MEHTNSSVPRLLIAADRSSAGKTTIATGLMSVLSKEGHVVQPFKVGLDYIDTSYHSEVTGRFSRNLDGYLMERHAIIETFYHAMRGADIGIIEGVRGLYEGLESLSDVGSTAQIAKMLNCPVILIIDARSITRSTAALVKGYISFDRRVDIRGVILNKIGSQTHAAKAKKAIEHYTGIEVIGQIPRKDSMHLTMRHLGLVPASEGLKRNGNFRKQLDTIENVIQSIDVDKVLQIAKSAGKLPRVKPKVFVSSSKGSVGHKKRVRIGVACDEAFSFYYRDLFDLFSLNGTKTIPFSPLHDEKIPDVDGLYIGGGYPEIFADELESNSSMRDSIAAHAQADLPVFAECGGLMYLTESLTYGGRSSKMVGVIPANADMANKRVIGYVTGTTVRDNVIGQKGTKFRGHEFHYSELTDLGNKPQFAFQLQKGTGISDGRDGVQVGQALASFTHFHPLSYPNLATTFARSCAKFSDRTVHSK
ncbi:MAG: Ni-sirohydrochlorin a,c-diamide synthase [Euryarchaeota archaeon]|nr:Ni-sirohydrochlorin a,c-diamide synthase [Euryarchaeota archaeon]